MLLCQISCGRRMAHSDPRRGPVAPCVLMPAPAPFRNSARHAVPTDSSLCRCCRLLREVALLKSHFKWSRQRACTASGSNCEMVRSSTSGRATAARSRPFFNECPQHRQAGTQFFKSTPSRCLTLSNPWVMDRQQHQSCGAPRRYQSCIVLSWRLHCAACQRPRDSLLWLTRCPGAACQQQRPCPQWSRLMNGAGSGTEAGTAQQSGAVWLASIDRRCEASVLRTTRPTHAPLSLWRPKLAG